MSGVGMKTASDLRKGRFDRRMRRAGGDASGPLARSWMAGLVALAVLCPRSRGAEAQATERFYEEIEPILAEHCYACHGLGMKKGGVTLDEFASDEALVGNHDLWWKVLK